MRLIFYTFILTDLFEPRPFVILWFTISLNYRASNFKCKLGKIYKEFETGEIRHNLQMHDAQGIGAEQF